MIAALGCNVAWGLTDGVMYLVGIITERTREQIRPRLRSQDFKGALGIFLAGHRVDLPAGRAVSHHAMISAPALKLSRLVAVVMLFLSGWVLARHAGGSTSIAGLAMAAIGAAAYRRLDGLGRLTRDDRRDAQAQGVRQGARATARRARQAAAVGGAQGAEGLRRVRRPRRRRQGRHDQGDHRAREPARVPRRGAARADRAREEPDVHAALHAALAGRRRDRDLRPQLVQPRRRRAGHGVLQRGGRRKVPASSCRWSSGRWSSPGSSCSSTGSR